MKDKFGNELDEMRVEAIEFTKEIDGKNYLVKTQQGTVYGYATVKDGVCTKWSTYGIDVPMTFYVESDNTNVICELSEFNGVRLELEGDVFHALELKALEKSKVAA